MSEGRRSRPGSAVDSYPTGARSNGPQGVNCPRPIGRVPALPCRNGPNPLGRSGTGAVLTRETAPMSAALLAHVHQQFESALPAVTNAARYAFRRRRPQDRDEAVAEAHAAAWSAWHGL